MSKLTGSKKATQFTESVIREMTRLNQLHGGVNLSQGFPDFPAPAGDQGRGLRGDQRRRQPVRRHLGRAAAARGDRARVHAALRPAGRRRRAGDRLLRRHRSDDGDDDGDHRSGRRGRHLRAVLRELRARRDPLGRDAALRHAARQPRRGRFDPDELAAAFNDKTKAIIINTPNNPTGKVFTRDELETIAALCRKWDAIAISDEIYEHIIYDGHRHVPIATIEGMADRTVTINGLSKTYSVTGWRVGWTISPPSLTGAIRKVHDFLTVGARGAAAGSRRRRARPAGRLLHRARGALSAAPRRAARHPRAAPLHRATSRTARTTS